MAEEFATFDTGDDDLKTVEYADREGNIRTIRAKDGVLKSKDADDEGVLRSFGYSEVKSPKKADAPEPEPEEPSRPPAEELRESASGPPDQEKP